MEVTGLTIQRRFGMFSRGNVAEASGGERGWWLAGAAAALAASAGAVYAMRYGIRTGMISRHTSDRTIKTRFLLHKLPQCLETAVFHGQVAHPADLAGRSGCGGRNALAVSPRAHYRRLRLHRGDHHAAARDDHGAHGPREGAGQHASEGACAWGDVHSRGHQVRS